MDDPDPHLVKLYNPDTMTRILNNVKEVESGCWEWQGTLTSDGYGIISVGGREEQEKVRVHRWSLQLKLGGELPNGVFACHKCDNPACMHPEHLYPGTHQDNMDDMKAKGRAPVSRARAVLSDDEVRDIRSNDYTLGEIMDKYGVSKSTASYIRSGKTYKHV